MESRSLNKKCFNESFEEYINIGNRVSPEILVSLEEIENPDRFVDTIASNIYLKSRTKTTNIRRV